MKHRTMTRRDRIMECEPCGKCGAPLGDRCRNYKGRGKAPCHLRDVCVRCRAQAAECVCGGPYRSWAHYRTGVVDPVNADQLLLFPDR